MTERQASYGIVSDASRMTQDSRLTHEPYSGLPLPDTSHVLTFTIGLPVSLNAAYPTNFKTGRRFTSKAATAFKDETCVIARLAANAARWESGSGPLGLRLVLWFPNKRRADIDNKIKLALDSIAGALGVDDAVFDELHVYRAGVSAEPRCEVTVWHL